MGPVALAFSLSLSLFLARHCLNLILLGQSETELDTRILTARPPVAFPLLQGSSRFNLLAFGG